jgi:NADPH:quinone reductase
MSQKIPAKMPAITIVNPGPNARLELTELPVPEPGPHEILLKVEAAGLNRGDLMQAAGMYPSPPGSTPTMGLEAAGTVVAIGGAVKKWKAGDKVCVLVAGGGYAGYCIAHEGSTFPRPGGFSMVEAAALPEAYCTVWTNVIDRARMKPGETFLVHGGASGIGTTAIMLFAERGHRVFTTAGTAEKCALCEKLGAARAVNYRTENFGEIVLGETGNKGVDVILDMVGGDYIQRNIDCLAREGRLVNIAYQKGAKVEVNFLTVMLKRLTLSASTLRIRSHEEKAAIVEAVRKEVWPLLEKGKLRPVIDSTFPLAEAGKAHARMVKGEHSGKIILTP